MKEYCAFEDSLKISMRATRHRKEGKGWYTITVQGPGGYEVLEIALKELLRWRPDFDIDEWTCKHSVTSFRSKKSLTSSAT